MSLPDLHDGDTFSVGKYHAEYLDTRGRIGLRVADRNGYGLLFERDDIDDMIELMIRVRDDAEGRGAWTS